MTVIVPLVVTRRRDLEYDCDKRVQRRDRQINMPELSRFHGIVIHVYYRDHSPAHFHAEYGSFEITVEIETGIVAGRFPRRALNLVLEWYGLHVSELTENWARARQMVPLEPIPPLE